MGLYATENPDVNSGPIHEFGFHKIERQTKTVINSMLNNFFSKRSKAYDIVIPEISSLQNIPNSPENTKVHNRRDFPFEERKFPMIVTTIAGAKERKSYIGADDLLLINTRENPDGTKIGHEVFAGMADIDLMLIIVSTSADERSKLAELIYMCFTHFYRGQFIYQDDIGNMFSITPGVKPVDFGAETEVTDESKTTLIYVKDMGLSTFIEYHFEDVATGDKLFELKNIETEIESGPVES